MWKPLIDENILLLSPADNPHADNGCVRQLVRVYPCPRQLRFRYARTHHAWLTPGPAPGSDGGQNRFQSREIKINTTLQSDLTRVVHKIWLIGWKCWPPSPPFPQLSLFLTLAKLTSLFGQKLPCGIKMQAANKETALGHCNCPLQKTETTTTFNCLKINVKW